MAITPDESRNHFGTSGLIDADLYLNLFSDDETIGAGTVAGSLTVLGTAAGYKEATLVGVHWAAAAAGGTTTIQSKTFGTSAAGTWTGGSQASAGGTCTFQFSGSIGNVYGYAITTATGLTGTLVAAEKFNTAQMVSANGDKISVVPQIKLV